MIHERMVALSDTSNGVRVRVRAHPSQRRLVDARISMSVLGSAQPGPSLHLGYLNANELKDIAEAIFKVAQWVDQMADGENS